MPYQSNRAAPRKILVCGSRDWTDTAAIHQRLNQLLGPVTVIHGAAKGADRIAANWAALKGHETQAFPADWTRHGKRAGILRNLEMLDRNPDLVIAFQIGNSHGTQHTINEARRHGIPVEVHHKLAAAQPLWTEGQPLE